MNVTSLQELIVPLSNAQAQAQARVRQDRLTKPAGSLGRLEEISIWLAGVHGVNPPRAINDPHLVILAGDHGITEAGVSAFPAEVTRQMVHNFVAGGAAATVLARAYDVDVSVFDISVNAPAETFPESVTRYKVSSGSSRCDTGAAISTEEASAAFFAGRQIAHDLGDGGVDLLLTGDMGIGNTTIASSLISLITQQTNDDHVGRGTGINDEQLAHKRNVIKTICERWGSKPLLPLELLAAIGGSDFAAMAGLLVGAAERGIPVVIDGMMSTASALVADLVHPNARAWWLASHRSVEPAHAVALQYLGLVPLIDFNFRLGEGTGALMVVPVIRGAQAILAEMATFADAGVSDKSE